MKLIEKIANIFERKSHEINSVTPSYSTFDFLTSSRSSYLNEYKGWVFAAVSLIAGRMGVLDFHLLNDKGKPIEHEYLQFITFDLIEAVTSFMKLNGSAYIWKVMAGNRVVGLNVLRPDIVKAEYKKGTSEIIGYSYNLNNKKISFKKDEIIAIYNFNPKQIYPFITGGVSDVQAAAIAIDTDNAASTWNWKFFENNAAPGFGLSTPGTLTDAMYERVKASWENKYKGVNNSHKVAIFEGGLMPVNISPSQKEMDFVEQRRWSRDEILSIFKIPKALIGLGEGSGANMNIRPYEIILAKNALQPIAIKIQEALSTGLFGSIGRFEFVNVVPQDSDEARKDFEVGGITLNEFRIARGYKAISGGDVFKNSEPQAQKTDEPKQNKYEQVIKKIIRQNIKGTEENAETKWEKREKMIAKYEKIFKQKLLNIFEKQEKEIIEKISKKSAKSLSEIPEVDNTKYGTLIYSSLKDSYVELYNEEGTAQYKELGLDTVFRVGDDEVREIQEIIAEWGKHTNETTNLAIRMALMEAIDKGEGVSEMIDRLRLIFSDLKQHRLEMIARTETIHASTMATIRSWKTSGVVTGKQWWTSVGERTCPLCRSLHGKTIGLETNYFDKGDTLEVENEKMKFDFRDVAGPPLHPFCRCTLIPITK